MEPVEPRWRARLVKKKVSTKETKKWEAEHGPRPRYLTNALIEDEATPDFHLDCSFTARLSEWRAWRKASKDSDVSFNRWVRDALNEQAEYEDVIRKEQLAAESGAVRTS